MRIIVFAFLASSFCWGQTGASQQSTKQSGVGAVLRNTQAKANDTISLFDFGAKCDGHTDDSASFTKAIAAAPTGATILVPATNCLITTGFTINNRISIQSGAPAYPTATLLAGADINMITITGDGSSSSIVGIALDANGHSGAKGIVMAGTISSPVTNVTIDHVIWNGNFLDALTGTYNYFAHYKDIRVFGAQTGFALGPQANSQDMTNVSFQDNQATVSNGINWTNSQMLAIHGLTMECGTIFSASNSYGASIIGGYMENQLSAGCAPMSIADGATSNQAYVNFGAAFGGSPAYGDAVEGILFNGSAAYGVKVGYASGVQMSGNAFLTELKGVLVDIQPQASQVISAATNAAAPVFTVPATPIALTASQSVKISGFTGGWSTVNGTYVDTNVSATTFTAAGAPDTSGFGPISGSPVAQFYAANKDMHIGPNSYGALSQADAIGFTASNADTTATNVSSLMATPFIATYGMPAPQASHLKPGYGAIYWGTTDGTGTAAGAWRGLWNNNGVSATTFPVTDLEASATSVTDASYFNGSVILQPQGSTRATPAAGYSNFALRANGKNFYINLDDSAGSQCGVPFAACMDLNGLEPLVIRGLGSSTTQSISNQTNASPVVFTVGTAPSAGQIISITGYTGSWAAANCNNCSATNISGTTFSIAVDSTGFGSAAGTPILHTASKLMCWKSDGKTLGYSTAAEILTGVCH